VTGQVATGAPPFSSVTGGPDVINSGNVFISSRHSKQIRRNGCSRSGLINTPENITEFLQLAITAADKLRE
jgi:hypothetical protein